MNNHNFFINRLAIIATMHEKERVIAPILLKKIGLKAAVPPNFNTDEFGTFTRDIKRLGTQIEAARLKAEKALELTGESLAIASEGSFAPHPFLPYVSSNREILLLLDKQNNLEIIGEEFSLETNHNHQEVNSVADALKFADKVGFPEHGLVVMVNQQSTASQEIIKGITTKEELINTVEFALTKSTTGTAHIETDMRALYNPTRMKNIAKATQDLIKKVTCFCPQCSTPGFTIIARKKGLPCASCNFPTELIRADIYECQKCGFKEEKLFPHGIEWADPAQCNYCNP